MSALSNYRRTRPMMVGLVTLFLVGSCGGGGGGSGSSSGGGGGGSGLTFTLDRTSISFDYVDTSSPSEQVVVATATGTLPSTLYIGAQDQSTYLNPAIQALLSGAQATFRILPQANLSPGTYSGTLRLMACADQACVTQLGNSPLSVNYSILVRPGLRVRPEGNPTYTFNSGSEGIANFTVQLPEGATSFLASTINGGSICRIGNVTATAFDLIAASVPPGDHLCQFQVESGGKIMLGGANFHVAANPAGYRDLSVAEDSLTLATVEGASLTRRLHVTPSTWDSDVGAEAINYANGGSDWLTLTPATDGFDVVASAANLAAGTYYATVRVFGRSPYYSQSVNVGVALTVGPGLIGPADIMPTVSNLTASEDLGGSTLIQLADGPVVQWSASTDVPWLQLTRPSGDTGTPLEFSYDNSAFRALTNGRTHTAVVTVTTANPAIAPVEFRVIVDKRLAQVSGLGPYLHVSGAPIRAYVRGVGFSAIGNLSSLAVDGAPGAVFTAVNDTTLLLQIPALPAGSYPVHATNGLGAAVESRTLKVVAPVSFAYASLPNDKPVGNVIYDAERRTVYLTDRAEGAATLLRFKYDGAGWVATPLATAGASDIALSNDGSALLEGVVPDSMRSRNISTLDIESESRFTGDGTLLPTWYNGRQLAVANDGRVWLANPGYPYARRLSIFDPLFGTFTPVLLPGAGSLSSAELEVPRDGSRVIIGEIDGQAHGLGIYDTVTDTYTNISPVESYPQGWGYGFRMHSSDDGSRVSFNGLWVFNRDMQLHANLYDTLRVINDWTVAYGLMSPDGRRLYAIAYDPRDYYQNNTPLPPPISKPRVYVVDTSGSTPTPASANVLGFFEIDDYPICRYSNPCDPQTRGAISPDGRTLFFAGADHLVVVPVPAENTLIPMAKIAPPVMKLWKPRALN